MNQLAIVIPYYKIDFFEATLQSLVRQTNQAFTVYIGNDASPNDPLPLITHILKDREVHYFNYEDNLGGQNLAMQWERILENVTEDWFQILGDDDMIADNFVEAFYNSIDCIENNINLIRVQSLYVNDNHHYYRSGKKYNNVAYTKELLTDKINYVATITLSENIFKKSRYDVCGFRKYPIAWHSDEMMILEISNFGKYYYCNDTFVKIYNGSKNLSGSVKNIKEKFAASQDFIIDILILKPNFLDNETLHRYFKNLLLNARTNHLKFNTKTIQSLVLKGYLKLAIKLMKFNFKSNA